MHGSMGLEHHPLGKAVSITQKGQLLEGSSHLVKYSDQDPSHTAVSAKQVECRGNDSGKGGFWVVTRQAGCTDVGCSGAVIPRSAGARRFRPTQCVRLSVVMTDSACPSPRQAVGVGQASLACVRYRSSCVEEVSGVTLGAGPVTASYLVGSCTQKQQSEAFRIWSRAVVATRPLTVD